MITERVRSEIVTPFSDLVPKLDEFPGTASVWCGPASGPAAFARDEHVLHYAASTMKVGVMVAAFRAAQEGRLDLDQLTTVHNEHVSTAPGAPIVYRNDQEYDSDDAVWARMGEQAPLRWLITRMIVKSSNLATNLVIGALGPNETAFAQVNQVWRDAGARNAHTDRGIEDYDARGAGISNEVTTADLAALFGGLAAGTLADPAACAEMLDILAGQEMLDDLPRGLPEGTRVALKNGWVTGERHSCAVVFPADADPYVLAVCTTGDVPDDQACDLLADVARASWAMRSTYGYQWISPPLSIGDVA
jgi:beta-lactamase class A